MTADEYQAACKREIAAARKECGEDSPQAQLTGYLAGEVVRLRTAIDTERADHADTQRQWNEALNVGLKVVKERDELREQSNTDSLVVGKLQAELRAFNLPRPTITDTDRLNWLTFTDDSGDFGSSRAPNTLSFSEQRGWTAYRAGGKPTLDVKYWRTAREAIDDAVTNPRE